MNFRPTLSIAPMASAALASSILISACVHAPQANTEQPAAMQGQAAVSPKSPAVNDVAVVSDETREPAKAHVTLPDQADWRDLYDIGENLDLTRPDIKLTLSSGGSSVYAVVNQNGKAIGAVLPPNAATKLAGEIMAFNLARAVGVADIYQPAVYHRLQGANLKAFTNLVPKSPIGKPKSLKEQNRVAVLALIKKNPGGIDTAFKMFGAKPNDYDALVNWKANKFETSHKLPGSKTAFAEFLKCKGAKPSSSVNVTVAKGTSNELAMARQLSSIFLIDALTQQWDRFSGGNLQTSTKDGVVSFAANDNGGTWGGTAWTNKFLAIVTRFDRGVAERILEMEELFTKNRSFLGIQTESEFIHAMNVEKFPTEFKAFKKSLTLVADHIRKHQGCYFD